MAHLRELKQVCNHRFCTKLATHEAVDNHNERAGVYCKAHAQERLKVLLKEVL